MTEKLRDDATIGVLELQGDFAEHTAMLLQCGARNIKSIRLPAHLNGIDALVLPGGESTVISKLLVELKMMDHVRQLATSGLPMFGTCAGCILLAKDIAQRPEQPRIGVLNITVDRNAYGTQLNSFEALVHSEFFANSAPLRVVQIRAPAIVAHEETVKVLAEHGGHPILVRQGYLLACTFHPELTDDNRVHKYFLRIVSEAKQKASSV